MTNNTGGPLLHCCLFLFFSVPPLVVPLGLADGYGVITGPSPPDNIRFGGEGASDGTSNYYHLTVPKEKVLTGIKVKGKRDELYKLNLVKLRVNHQDLFGYWENYRIDETLRLDNQYV